MARPKSLPSYRKHKQSGQAIVTLADGYGKRCDVLLGKYGTAASRLAYERTIAEWLQRDRRLPAQSSKPTELTVSALILAYWRFAENYYGYKDSGRGDGHALRHALRVVKELYGPTLAAEFSCAALKTCRDRMIAKDWSRTYINHQMGKILRMFRWGASEDLLPGAVHDQLKKVDGLRRGKTKARETEKVKPVSAEHVEATLPHLSPTVAAMVQLQLITGCRPGEVCLIRPCDLDMSDAKCWVYRPARHKTEHHDHDRLILIGPKGQAILGPYLGMKTDAYCFSPRSVEQQRLAERRKERKTKLWPSHVKHQAKKRKKRRKREPTDRYCTGSYRRAIDRACVAANVPTWGPNRLRHSRATELRSHGLDVVSTILGHSKLETTQVYSEKDLAAAMELISKIG